MKKMKMPLGLMSLVVMAGCSSSSFESTPVRVPTNSGDVYCQLYTDSVAWWDRSITRPSSMTQEQADQICYDVGAEIAARGR